MKICVDENIPLVTVLELRKLGHDVLDIRGTPDQSMSDEALWEMAQQEERLLITTDKGFGQHRHEAHHGILIVRLRQPNEQKTHARAMQAIGQFKEEEWIGLTVVMRDTVQSVWRAT
ncbi:MAG TPA: DUF5615 family PIN-like protein [Thermodesulfobacteriota bacterium]|nr:DUF5615 family PIN-like protein [Thermodesulfobacteriota bacterium]